ncbi:MAG: nucleotide sugar dehydrogenase [Planctomycetes bacterium]|nr:nucleotide sugar dehydrogenase [Planctomycetota bacterium]
MITEESIINRQARVGVIGMGYVGLPLVHAFCDNGFEVLGFDIDPAKVERLNRGESYIKHIPSETIAGLVASGRFSATTDYAQIGQADAILICVPTPLTKTRDPDLSFVECTARSIAEHLREGQLIVLESTTYPGTTDEVLQPILETSGLECGADFYLAYSPEREDPGNPKYSARNIPKVVGGTNDTSCKLAAMLYDQVVVSVVTVSSTREAEAVKMFENIYRSVNIALVNELKIVFEKMDIDVWEVLEAAYTKPFGWHPFYPGPGLGGHCIPIDPFYLSWKARQYDTPTRFIELAGEINSTMPARVADKVMRSLNRRGKPLKGSKVLVLGAAYKPNVDDIRESPSLKILELLEREGAVIGYHDPHIPAFPDLRDSHLRLESVKLDEQTLREQDCVVIVTDHSAYDYEWIVEHADLIVDTRNATAHITSRPGKIVKA